MFATAPASSANLGPGFDFLGLAIGLHTSVRITPGGPLRLSSPDFDYDGPLELHLGVRVASEVLGHNNFHIEVRSTIPVSRGLGSSAALALAAAAAAGADWPLTVACKAEGHPDNAAASYLGGLTAAAFDGDGTLRVRRLALDPRLRAVLVIPDVELATKQARSALSPVVPRSDATANASRIPFLIDGLRDMSLLEPWMSADQLHQNARTPLFPSAPRILDALRDGGALMATWSGAGPTMIGLGDESSVKTMTICAERTLRSEGLQGRVQALPIEMRGLQYGPERSAEGHLLS